MCVATSTWYGETTPAAGGTLVGGSVAGVEHLGIGRLEPSFLNSEDRTQVKIEALIRRLLYNEYILRSIR